MLASNAYLAVLVIDGGISYTYLDASYDSLNEENETLANLILQGGKDYSKKEFLHLLRQAMPEAFIVEEADKILVGSAVFEFTGDKLVKVK